MRKRDRVRRTRKRPVLHHEQEREPNMARRGKTSPAEGLMDIVAMLPWWVGVAQAGTPSAAKCTIHSRCTSTPVSAAASSS